MFSSTIYKFLLCIINFCFAFCGEEKFQREMSKKGISISTEAFHTATCEEGVLYTYGRGRFGKLGHGGKEDVASPRVVEMFRLAGIKVKGVSLGCDHTVVWTEDGNVYTFGRVFYNVLGHDTDGDCEDECVPRLVGALEGHNVVGAAAGYKHTVVWTEEGQLYTFGCGRGGKLGHGEEEDELLPRRVDALMGKRVVGATAGAFHTVAWIEGGGVYTFGYGEEGMLGHGGQEPELLPRVVGALAGKNVVGATIEFHTVVWTEGGEVYTFGEGESGKLGHGDGVENELLPRVVEALNGKMVVGASAGMYHTVVWTEEGEVYTCGYGRYGALGHGGAEDELVPRLVMALTGMKVAGAAAGSHHTLVWTDRGQIYTVGNGMEWMA